MNRNITSMIEQADKFSLNQKEKFSELEQQLQKDLNRTQEQVHQKITFSFMGLYSELNIKKEHYFYYCLENFYVGENSKNISSHEEDPLDYNKRNYPQNHHLTKKEEKQSSQQKIGYAHSEGFYFD